MKKQEILSQIEILFYNKTFKEVSLQNIADLLWIKKASLYYYFPSKDDLQEELIEYSFNNYSLFIDEILKKDLKTFIEEFIYFPTKSKNLFSIINQKEYCKNKKLVEKLNNKKNIILSKISDNLKAKYNFSEEKSFIFISLLEDIWRKKCIFGECPINIKKVIDETYEIFK